MILIIHKKQLGEISNSYSIIEDNQLENIQEDTILAKKYLFIEDSSSLEKSEIESMVNDIVEGKINGD